MQKRALASGRKSDDTSVTPSVFVTSELRTSHLFTSQQLYGDAATGLSRHAVFLERAKAETGRDELAVKVTLAAYLVVRLVDAYFSAPPRAAGGDEGLDWQVGAVRRHLSELPASEAEVGHLVGIVESIAAGGESSTTLRIGLTAYAYFLEHEGRFGEALEVVLLAARAHGPRMSAMDFAACALFSARLNRLLARWGEATAAYQAAERAATTAGDHVLRLRGRLGQAAVNRGQGNLPLAQTIAEEVLHEATQLQLVEVQLLACGDLSMIYSSQGRKLEALEAEYQAFRLAPDTAARMRALGDLGVSFLEVGAYDTARLAFEIVLRSSASFWVRNNALIELMDLESLAGNRIAFERLRIAAETERGRMPPSMAADYLRKVGVGYARFGQIGRAREVLDTALALAETHRLNTWYFKIEASIRDLDKVSQPNGATKLGAAVEQAPVIQQMEAGLREYAALQPA